MVASRTAVVFVVAGERNRSHDVNTERAKVNRNMRSFPDPFLTTNPPSRSPLPPPLYGRVCVKYRGRGRGRGGHWQTDSARAGRVGKARGPQGGHPCDGPGPQVNRHTPCRWSSWNPVVERQTISCDPRIGSNGRIQSAANESLWKWTVPSCGCISRGARRESRQVPRSGSNPLPLVCDGPLRPIPAWQGIDGSGPPHWVERPCVPRGERVSGAAVNGRGGGSLRKGGREGGWSPLSCHTPQSAPESVREVLRWISSPSCLSKVCHEGGPFETDSRGADRTFHPPLLLVAADDAIRMEALVQD